MAAAVPHARDQARRSGGCRMRCAHSQPRSECRTGSQGCGRAGGFGGGRQ